MAIFRVSRNIIYNWLNNWESLGLVGLYNRADRGRKNLFDTQSVLFSILSRCISVSFTKFSPQIWHLVLLYSKRTKCHTSIVVCQF